MQSRDKTEDDMIGRLNALRRMDVSAMARLRDDFVYRSSVEPRFTATTSRVENSSAGTIDDSYRLSSSTLI